MAAAAALRLRNLALADEAAQRRVLEREVALARDIQLSLLPDQLPEIEGYDIDAETVPSRGVSGDFFEIIDHGDAGTCALLVADVSGKGIGASLLTASLEALMAGPLQAGTATGRGLRTRSRTGCSGAPRRRSTPRRCSPFSIPPTAA